jgi:hypothetical protein
LKIYGMHYLKLNLICNQISLTHQNFTGLASLVFHLSSLTDTVTMEKYRAAFIICLLVHVTHAKYTGKKNGISAFMST